VQQVNVASLGHVIKHFLEQAEQHAKEAQSKAEKITLDIEDLDAEEAPESLMLGKVSGEDTKDRTDRQIVTPWLKFLWETYRTVLDILRNNAKLETLYHVRTAPRFLDDAEPLHEFRTFSNDCKC
jgi:translation initiation factor 3 subunit A